MYVRVLPERPLRLYPRPVTHDGQLVQRRLAVEQHHVSVHQMALHCVTALYIKYKPTVTDL